MKKKNKNKKTQSSDWNAISEVRHQTPKPGFAFKNRKNLLSDAQARKDMRDY